MGLVRKILNTELVGTNPTENPYDIYPVTSTLAVYNEGNIRLDDILKVGYTYMGIATPDTIPADIPTPCPLQPKTPYIDGMFYIAREAGVYENLGGFDIKNGITILYKDAQRYDMQTPWQMIKLIEQVDAVDPTGATNVKDGYITQRALNEQFNIINGDLKSLNKKIDAIIEKLTFDFDTKLKELSDRINKNYEEFIRFKKYVLDRLGELNDIIIEIKTEVEGNIRYDEKGLTNEVII